VSGAAGGSGNGQAPTLPTGNGQAPTQGNQNDQTQSNTTQQGQTTGQAPTTGPLSDADLRRMQSELDEARRDAAKYRDELTKVKDAGLTEQQRREKEFADLQLRDSQAALLLQAERLENAVNRARLQAGIRGDVPAEDLAAMLSQRQAVTYDTENRPIDVLKALKDLAKDRTYLLADTSGTGTPPTGQQQSGQSGQTGLPNTGNQNQQVTSGGPLNPGKGAGTSGWTWDRISTLSKPQYDALSDVEKTAISQFIAMNPRGRNGRPN